ncbi:SET domain-containing protein [Thozetella sp. PMI_491]|nr:SET domain-containing protein [Thozetella sp. PMI_491]
MNGRPSVKREALDPRACSLLACHKQPFPTTGPFEPLSPSTRSLLLSTFTTDLTRTLRFHTMMKAASPLLSLVGVAAANIASHERSAGVCGYRALPFRLSSGGPVCLPDSYDQISLATGDSDIFEHHGANGHGCANGTFCNPHGGHNWTFSSPCFTSQDAKENICVFTDLSFAGGRGISLVTTARRAAYIASLPAFTDPDNTKGINQDLVRTTPAKYDIKEFPGKGFGLVAKGHIRRGELIMANTPSIFTDYRSFEWLTNSQYQALQATAVGYLPEAHQAAFLRLSTHDDASNMTRPEVVEKIASTNSFDIDAEVDDEVQDSGFFVVFPEISRMNHDCRPNSEYFFDYETMAHSIHAVRDILAGEELTLSYINPIMSRRERLRQLKRSWGFKCGCHMCTQEAAQSSASDDRITQIRSLLPEFKSYKAGSRATPSMAELLISLYQQENLWGPMYEAYTYAALEYNGVGEPWTATKYARLAIDHGIPAVGEDHSDVVEMTKLAEDPWNHWSWMLRTKKRMSWDKKVVVREED